MEIRFAVATYLRGTLSAFGFDPELVYSAEKFGIDDVAKIEIILTDVAGAVVESTVEAKGAFVYPVDYGRLTNTPGQTETGSSFRSTIHEIALYVPYNDERTPDENSFNFYNKVIDYLFETFDLALDLGLPGIATTSLYVARPPYYQPMEDDSIYHAAHFRIESRYPVTVGYCNGN